MFFSYALEISCLDGGCHSLWPHGGFTWWENSLQGLRSILHPGRGLRAIDNMGVLGCLLGDLELTWGCLGCHNGSCG